MPPVNRKSPSPVPRRRPVVAGTRTSGSDRTADSGTDTVTLAVPPAEAKRPKAVFRRRHRAEDIARLDSVDPRPVLPMKPPLLAVRACCRLPSALPRCC